MPTDSVLKDVSVSQLMAMLGFRVSFPTRPHFTEQHSPSVSGVCSRWENLSITPQHTPRIDYIAINIHRIVGIHRCDEFQFGASVVARQLGKFQVVDGKIPKLPKLQRLQKLSDLHTPQRRLWSTCRSCAHRTNAFLSPV